MDLYAKDHPFEAAALRMHKAKPKLRSFVFEELPPTVRHRIYRGLLLKPREWDDESEAPYFSEHMQLRYRIEGLMIDFLDDNHKMHPEIMRTNKRIHEEAATVLYGENWFAWNIYGFRYVPMFHRELDQCHTTLCPPRYSRLITKISLSVSVRGSEWDQTLAEIFVCIDKSLEHACKVLSWTDLKILMVNFYNSLSWENGRSVPNRYHGERCLEPLKSCRAEKFFVNTYVFPRYAAELKAVIEGPKNAEFQAYRQAMEDEPGSDFDEDGVSGLAEFNDEGGMDYVEKILNMKTKKDFLTWKELRTCKNQEPESHRNHCWCMLQQYWGGLILQLYLLTEGQEQVASLAQGRQSMTVVFLDR